MLEGCKTQGEALALLESHTAQLQAAAEAVIAREGYDYAVHIQLGMEKYPQRDYDSFCFPGGEYASLRIGIGEAEGQNWWCCLFPPLCLGASTVSNQKAEDACISVGLTPSQYKIITETEKPVYRVRFRILELFSGIK
jgi:stage II sporulation protein R